MPSLWGWACGRARSALPDRGVSKSSEGRCRGIPPFAKCAKDGAPSVRGRIQTAGFLTGLSARFGMTRVLLWLSARLMSCPDTNQEHSAASVRAVPPGLGFAVERGLLFPIVVFPNPQRDGAVESHPSQSARKMGQPSVRGDISLQRVLFGFAQGMRAPVRTIPAGLGSISFDLPRTYVPSASSGQALGYYLVAPPGLGLRHD